MPLSRFRVLQIGSGIALDYCGKLFSDFGADVVKLEPPGGDPPRSFPPVLEGGESGLARLNTNKRSVTQTPEALEALSAGADVVLDGRRLGADAMPSDWGKTDGSNVSWPAHDTVETAHPATTTISWFGDFGPYAGFAATEATIRALGSLVALTGRAEGPPTLATDCQFGIIAGLAAFIASAAGLYDRISGSRLFRERTRNRGQHRRIRGSRRVRRGRFAQASRGQPFRAQLPGRDLFDEAWPNRSYHRHTRSMAWHLRDAGHARACKEPAIRGEHRPPDASARDRCAVPAGVGDPNRDEWFELALEYQLPMAVVPIMADLLEQRVHRERGAFALQARGIAAGVVRTPLALVDDPHLIARGFWHRLDRPFIGKHWQSSAAFREGRDAYPVRRAAPTLGQDNDAILGAQLGRSREEIGRLAVAGVIGTVPKPRRLQSDQ